MVCPKCKIENKVIRDNKLGPISIISNIMKSPDGIILYNFSSKGYVKDNYPTIFTCANPECRHSYKAYLVSELYEEMEDD